MQQHFTSSVKRSIWNWVKFPSSVTVTFARDVPAFDSSPSWCDQCDPRSKIPYLVLFATFCSYLSFVLFATFCSFLSFFLSFFLSLGQNYYNFVPKELKLKVKYWWNSISEEAVRLWFMHTSPRFYQQIGNFWSWVFDWLETSQVTKWYQQSVRFWHQ